MTNATDRDEIAAILKRVDPLSPCSDAATYLRMADAVLEAGFGREDPADNEAWIAHREAEGGILGPW